jgi:peptidase E
MMEMQPVFLFAGGRSGSKDLKSMLHAVFEATRAKAPRVAYIGVANGDSLPFFNMIGRLLQDGGAGTVELARIASRNADIGAAKAAIESADAVFVSGGDVEAGMQSLQKHGLVEFLRDVHVKGKVFFGFSAGSIMLGTQWVRWRDPEDESTAELFPCIGLAPIICDTHDEGSDWEELRVLLGLEKEGTAGYGIPSDTCLVAYQNGRVAAMGGPIHRFVKEAGLVRAEAELVHEGQ